MWELVRYWVTPVLDSSDICNYTITMADISWTRDGIVFVCDAQKRLAGLQKHGVDFLDASTAFLDPHAISFYDTEHSNDEDRYALIGMAKNTVLVFVVHTERNGVCRIISARKATKNEVKRYGGQL